MDALEHHEPPRIVQISNFLHRALGVFALGILLLPLLWLLLSALRAEHEFYRGATAVIPETISAQALRAVLGEEERFRRAILNSLIYSFSTAFISTLAGLWVAMFFRRSHSQFFKKNLGFGLIAAKFLPAATIVPGVFWFFNQTDLLDSLVGLILINQTIGLSFAVLMLTPILSRVPQSHLDLAALEGATDSQIISLVLWPRTRAPLLIVGILTLTFAWNEFLLSSFLTETGRSQTLSVVVAGAVGQHRVRYAILAAGGLISLIPGVIVILFFALYQAKRRREQPSPRH